MTEPREDATPTTNLPDAGRALLDQARGGRAGRAARTLLPGAHTPLKQTLLALIADQSLAEHNTPTAAALQVVTGRVRLVAGEVALELSEGDHAAIPPARHSVEALEDSVLLLTVAQ
jgi:quercetin dioxygenase-like cupin family protein